MFCIVKNSFVSPNFLDGRFDSRDLPERVERGESEWKPHGPRNKVAMHKLLRSSQKTLLFIAQRLVELIISGLFIHYLLKIYS